MLQRLVELRKHPLNSGLAELRVGSLVLTPTFESDVLEYSATTTNATNKVSFAATSAEDTVVAKFGDAAFNSGDTLTWAVGENTLTITVKDAGGADDLVYTVVVTKSE